MMYPYRSRKGGGSRFWRAASVALLAAVGVAVVLWAITVFRERAEARRTDSDAAQSAAREAERLATMSVDATAVLRDTSGVALGVVTRSGTVEAPLFRLVAQLATVDSSTSSYGVWMLKDGLADVVHAGDLALRADGSWALEFSIADPLDYPNVVVTIEPNDGDARPSGNRVAEGRFGE